MIFKDKKIQLMLNYWNNVSYIHISADTYQNLAEKYET